MIKSLHISNYALIDEVSLELTSGLNIITGETGAGKSIMLSALSLLLGSRAETKVVTDPQKKSVVEAIIDVSSNESLKNYFDGKSYDWNSDGLCILRREISTTGRSRAFINDTPVNVTELADVSRQLIDIHSQHQNLLLADPDFQLKILDSLALDEGEIQKYQLSFAKYRQALKEYSHAKRELERTSDKEDELNSILERIDSLKLKKGEQEELEAEKESLARYQDIKSSLSTILNDLMTGEGNVLDSLRRCRCESEEIKTIIKDGQSLYDRLSSTYLELQDIAENFETIDSAMSEDPERLLFIEDRLDRIYRLEKKLNVSTIVDLLDKASEIRSKLDNLAEGENKLKSLRDRALTLRDLALNEAKKISQLRRREGAVFIKLLEEKSAPLGMKNIKAEIDFRFSNELYANGIDIVEFKFAFNKNQEPLPVGKTASGGEISRLMLCIKSIIADKMQFPTIIFDEVDTGVSGEIAARMGDMMLDISSGIQVIAITHLPQVAAKGQTHFKVFKEDDEKMTHTHLKVLSKKERIKELAVMLSGSSVNEAALANAESLLGNS
ncbi:MAG: DNA repair protein RecN [Muribaculaceae bacterium]|nr:DNA repair protein RecN [Muribaculaceae bacterium]